MTTLYLALLLVASSAVLGYSAYVHILVLQADFYSRAQKVMQCLVVWLLPLVGALLVHWFYRAHRAPAHTPERAFIPQRDPAPDEWRAFHRPPDPPSS